MKRILALILAVMLCIATLTACTQPESEPVPEIDPEVIPETIYEQDIAPEAPETDTEEPETDTEEPETDTEEVSVPYYISVSGTVVEISEADENGDIKIRIELFGNFEDIDWSELEDIDWDVIEAELDRLIEELESLTDDPDEMFDEILEMFDAALGELLYELLGVDFLAEGSYAYLIISETTQFPFETELNISDTVTGWFSADSLMVSIYPPVYNIDILAVNMPESADFCPLEFLGIE